MLLPLTDTRYTPSNINAIPVIFEVEILSLYRPMAKKDVNSTMQPVLIGYALLISIVVMAAIQNRDAMNAATKQLRIYISHKRLIRKNNLAVTDSGMTPYKPMRHLRIS